MLEAVLGINAAPFKTGLEEAKHHAAELKNELGSMFVGAIGVAGIGAMIEQTTAYAAEVGHLAETYGVSTDSVQKFGNVAAQEGSSLEAVAKAFGKLEVAQAKALRGNEEQIAAFKGLGISVEDLQTLSPEELMLKIGSSSMNAADMVSVLGKSALELRVTLGMLADGSAKFGDAISENTIRSLKESEDAIKRWSQNVRAFFAEGIGAIVGLAEKATGTGQFAGDKEDAERRERILDLMKREIALRKEGKAGLADNLREARLKEQSQLETEKPKHAREHGDEEAESKKEKQLTLAQRLAAIEAEHALKQKDLQEQIKNVIAQQVDLRAKLDKTTDTAERERIEKEIVARYKEQLEIGDRIDAARKSAAEKALKEREKMETEQIANQAKLEKAKFENLSPSEKQADVLKRLQDLDKKLASGAAEYTSPGVLTQNLTERERLKKELTGLMAQNAAAQPNFDSLKAIGGGLAGVNYDAARDAADQKDLLADIAGNTAEWLNKKLEIKIPQSSFGGGGSPGT